MFDEMLHQANMALENAYAPYSNYPVGCAIKTASGKIFAGCNVENAAYGSSLCAEASAVSTMIAAGEQTISEIVIINATDSTDSLCYPCGNCRQIIREFGSDQVKIHIYNITGLQKTMLLGELLPHVFMLSRK